MEARQHVGPESDVQVVAVLVPGPTCSPGQPIEIIQGIYRGDDHDSALDLVYQPFQHPELPLRPRKAVQIVVKMVENEHLVRSGSQVLRLPLWRVDQVNVMDAGAVLERLGLARVRRPQKDGVAPEARIAEIQPRRDLNLGPPLRVLPIQSK